MTHSYRASGTPFVVSATNSALRTHFLRYRRRPRRPPYGRAGSPNWSVRTGVVAGWPGMFGLPEVPPAGGA
jgi:hypothetical protein